MDSPAGPSIRPDSYRLVATLDNAIVSLDVRIACIRRCGAGGVTATELASAS
jgi:hypothetical protein